MYFVCVTESLCYTPKTNDIINQLYFNLKIKSNKLQRNPEGRGREGASFWPFLVLVLPKDRLNFLPWVGSTLVTINISSFVLGQFLFVYF